MSERRRIGRTRVLKSAKIVINRSSVLDCVVRNLTNSGACLAVPNAVALPEAFDLTMDDLRTCRHCIVVWKHIDKAGVAFRD
jgi:hypothetical protein